MTYQWYRKEDKNSPSVPIEGATNEKYEAVEPGIYKRIDTEYDGTIVEESEEKG